RPEFIAGLGGWMAPLHGQATVAASPQAGGAAAQAEAQTVFQMLPLAAPGLTEYTVEIDGQTLRYRNGQASWQHFVWPGPGTPGVRITGVGFDGKPLTFFNEPGRFGLEKMINSAQRKRVDAEVFELRWPLEQLSVGLRLRIISNAAASPQASGSATAAAGGFRPGALPAIIAGPEADAVPPTRVSTLSEGGAS